MNSTDIGISEFSFGFAFLYEQTKMNWRDLTAAPILPSSRQEKKEAWDARLPRKGADYYYQFKVSDYLFGNNAKFFQRRTKYYSDPYFRIMLYRDENKKYTQHRTLKRFSANHPRTYYVAPQFVSNSELRDAFLDEKVYTFSRLIPVKRCRDIREDDSRPHCIIFQKGVRKWNFHSKAYECDESYFGEELYEFYQKKEEKDHWQTIDEKYIMTLYEKIIDDITKIDEINKHKISLEKDFKFDKQTNKSDPQILLEKISKLLAAYFGVTLVLVGEHRNQYQKNNKRIASE